MKKYIVVFVFVFVLIVSLLAGCQFFSSTSSLESMVSSDSPASPEATVTPEETGGSAAESIIVSADQSSQTSESSPTTTSVPTPTTALTSAPTSAPTTTPTKEPTKAPTKAPTITPTKTPTSTPTNKVTPPPETVEGEFVIINVYNVTSITYHRAILLSNNEILILDTGAGTPYVTFMDINTGLYSKIVFYIKDETINANIDTRKYAWKTALEELYLTEAKRTVYIGKTGIRIKIIGRRTTLVQPTLTGIIVFSVTECDKLT